MSFPSHNYQILSSSVNFEDEGVKGVTVTAHTVGENGCFSVKTVTDPLGDFNISVPKTANGSPYRVAVECKSPGYVDMTYSLMVGGFREPYLPVIYLLEAKKVLGTIEATVLDAGRNMPLGNVTVELRSGIGNDTGVVRTAAVSDNAGRVVFRGVGIGGYTVTAGRKYGVVDEREVIVSENKTYPLLLTVSSVPLSPDEIRVELTWLREDLDLDLRVIFDSSASHRCDVHYADKFCGGAKLYSLSDHGLAGGELLTLRQVAPSPYLFYITSSHPGDFLTAEVKVYSPSSDTPVLRLPFTAETGPNGSWLAFCLNGLYGLDSLFILDIVKSGIVTPSICDMNATVNWDRNSTAVERKTRRRPAALFVQPPVWQ